MQIYFLEKLLQKLVNKGSKSKTALKKFIDAKNRIREKGLRMQKTNMKKSMHNQQLIEILSKIRYDLEDSFKCYEFLKEDLSAEGEVKQVLGPLFTLNQEKAAQASGFT